MHRFASILSCSVILLAPAMADAHLRLTDPLPRYGDTQKSAPCGQANGLRSDNVYTFAPGETITIKWNEFVNHPGHYRISFDQDGDDDFVDPASYDDRDTAPSVLVDGIADKAGGDYEYELTLPNVECDNCTLQVIQVMTDKPPYGDGNDIYYQCVDLVLTGSPAADAGPSGGPDAGAPADPPSGEPLGGGCTTGSGTSGGAMVLLLGAAALAVRRRRLARTAK